MSLGGQFPWEEMWEYGKVDWFTPRAHDFLHIKSSQDHPGTFDNFPSLILPEMQEAGVAELSR